MGDWKTREADKERVNSVLGKIPKGEVLVKRIFTPEETASFIVSSRDLGYEWSFAKRILFDMSRVRSLVLEAYTSAGIPPEGVTEDALQDAISYGKDLTEPFDGVISGKDLRDGRMMVRYKMDSAGFQELVEQRFLAAAPTHLEVIDEIRKKQYGHVGIKGSLWSARIRGLPERQFDIKPEKYKVEVFNVAREVSERHYRGITHFFTESVLHPAMIDLRERVLDEVSGKLNLLLDNLEKLVTHQKDLSKVLIGTKKRASLLVS